MTSRIRLCGVSEVGPGEMLRVDQAGVQPLAVFNVDGGFFVTSNVCTHNVAMLTEGYLEGDIVECPLHGGCFNVKTGAATSFPCEKPLQTFPAIVDGDAVFTDV